MSLSQALNQFAQNLGRYPECFQYSEALHGDYAASYRQAVQLLIKNDYETIMNRITKENNQL